MLYSYYIEKIPFSRKRRIIGFNVTLGFTFDPTFDEKKLVISPEAEIDFRLRTQKCVKIDDTTYFHQNDGNFTSKNSH